MWMIVQGAYALVAWSVAVRAVSRAAALAGAVDGGVVEAVRAARRAGRSTQQLASDQMHPALVSVLSAETDGELGSDRADEVRMDYAVPVSALRGMATIGTSLGLLAAIATLRSSTGGGEAVAARAFGSALLGFATAVPMWSALALAGRHARYASKQLHRLALALEEDPSDGGRAQSQLDEDEE